MFSNMCKKKEVRSSAEGDDLEGKQILFGRIMMMAQGSPDGGFPLSSPWTIALDPVHARWTDAKDHQSY